MDTENALPESTEQEEDETGFDEGFAEPPPTETPGATDDNPAPTPAPTPAPEPQPEFVQITRAQLEGLQAAANQVAELRTTVERSFGTAFGKIGGIERILNDGGKVEIDQADIDALRSEGFETHARALEKVRDMRIVAKEATLPAEVLTEMRTSLKEEVMRELAIDQVADVHPDWNEVRQTPEFTAWKATLSAADQDQFFGSWNPRHVIKALDTFKAYQKAKAPAPPAPAPGANSADRKSRMTAAVTPRGTGAPARTAPDEDEFDAGFRE